MRTLIVGDVLALVTGAPTAAHEDALPARIAPDAPFPRILQEAPTIESIAPDPDHQPYTAIVVHPAVDLNRVEEVLVITGTQADLPPAAQQDLATAEAQHAADLSAERLPGIHDDQAPGTPANGTTPAAPGSPTAPAPIKVPHPLPTVHPDRFTSGSTPPAAQLTPGGSNSPQSSQPPASQQPPPAKVSPQPEAPK